MSVREIPGALIEKYATSVPRYTSYPTAVEFADSFGERQWRNLAASELKSAASLSLYFHIPFCRKLCYFCACNKVITDDRTVSVPYIKALTREMELYGELCNSAGVAVERIPIEQIHWGGGSPNFLTPEEMSALHRAALSIFPRLREDAEVSVELDPRTTSPEQIAALRSLGFNRVSFGVQDFDPEVQQAVNRVQSFESTLELVTRCREAGVEGVNLDLIYGLPLQTIAGFSRTLDRILEIHPDRIALYGYAHVTWLQKVQKSFQKLHLPTPAERIAIFQLAVSRLLAAGYEHIGLDHFALPGDSLSRALSAGTLNRNFMGYTNHKGAALLGFGASSISTLPGGFAQNEKSPQSYEQRIARGELATARGFRCSLEDQIRAELIQGVLCSGVVQFDYFNEVWGVDLRAEFEHEFNLLTEYIIDGLVRIDDRALRVTPLGRFFARNIASAFDTYLDTHREQERPVFSQAV